jgi:hypothetical protein
MNNYMHEKWSQGQKKSRGHNWDMIINQHEEKTIGNGHETNEEEITCIGV